MKEQLQMLSVNKRVNEYTMCIERFYELMIGQTMIWFLMDAE